MQPTAESMHRLVKLALDSGEASNVEEAQRIFSRYRLRVHLGAGWNRSVAGEAAFLTAVNCAARAFLGGVMVTGDMRQTLNVPLYRGRAVADVARELGGQLVDEAPVDVPTLVIGKWESKAAPAFCIQLGFGGWQAGCWSVRSPMSLSGATSNPLAGVAAAALGVNEAFLHVRDDLIAAGDRVVGISLWNPAAVDDWMTAENDGPELSYLPADLWLIGLGHLGQAYAWTLGMLPYLEQFPHVVLQDTDAVAESNLSTCMLVSAQQIGKRKTRVIAACLEAAGFTTALIERRFTEDHRVDSNEPTTALFGVDNAAARRAISGARFGLVIEAGLGSGYRDFRSVRTHVFPGPRPSTEVWTASDAIQRAAELSPVYEQMAETSKDRCGVTQLATRAVATPFVGAFAASLVLGELVRILHGGNANTTMDLQMKDLRHRAVAVESTAQQLLLPSYFHVDSAGIDQAAVE